MSYKEKSRIKHSLAYKVAGIINFIFVLIGLLFAMVGVSAIESETFAPAVVMIFGIFLMLVGMSNIIIMEGGDDEDEEAGDYQS